MGESIGRRECFASEMNAALGPYNEFVDVRDPEVFAVWHRRSGLRCLVCRFPVSPYTSSAKNPYVRHGKGNAAQRNSKAANAARETFLHYRLKHWVREELKTLGAADAEVEVAVGERRPDVFGHIAGRGYAVEIQWSPLDYADAATRTRELQAAGADEVLWLTRACSWVEQLPALGIKNFDPPGDDYRAHTGFLAYRPRAGLRVTETSVRDVLRGWVADEIAWAYRDHKKAGWATVTDWQQHTKAQADTIATQRRQLDAARGYIDTQARELTAAKTTAGNLETQRDTLANEKTTLQGRIEGLRQQAGDQQAAHAEKLAAAEARAGELNDELDTHRGINAAAIRKIKELEAQLAQLARSVRGWRTGTIALAVACVIILIAWLAT